MRFVALSVVLNHSSSQPSPLRGEGVNPVEFYFKPLIFIQYPLPPPPYQGEEKSETPDPLKRHGINASKPQSKMALSKRFKT